ncbi:family 20 glycosylhydrolase [Staphylococcus arlettae]|nr:family 20 glycosylhydrolase [Staphylococcus saprophyticus]MDN0189358.1 family 20 glycosylhydrolase [Staphylococcus arlettae]MDW3888638.1 family 20 glycosylhydrolase [Staphylococcus saprophyticus]MDW3978663.1 family 20 glycosylhydrolase [Staphylococcus saprophyticus]MDW4488841.1 family 20 glycosylhydrolase [Staphylococcus saprophyticus]
MVYIKIILSTSILLSYLILFNSFSVHAQDFQKGINVDIARKDYSLKSLKKIVDTIHENNGDYLQLHFSDNENYAIESQFFKHENISSQNYLSQQELKNLIHYSNKLNIMVVPEFDLPSHSKAWLLLLKNENSNLHENIVSDYSDETIDFFSNQKALEISKRQIKEILDLFHQPNFQKEQRIVLGGDEVPGGKSYQNDFINFMNEIGEYAYQNGYEPQIWNDSITKNGLKLLKNYFSVIYWKQSNNENNEPGITVEDFLDYNFKVYNYNFYSLYFLPSKNYSPTDIEEQTSYISWAYNHNSFYYLKNPYYEVDSLNIQGSALSFWGEHATGMREEEVLNQELPLIRTYLNK